MSDRVAYEVERVVDRVEIRRYAAVVLATVRDAHDGEAFGILFRYISGHNKSRRGEAGERIAMTAPVFSDAKSFSFAMPAAYSMATAPVPLDSRSVVEEVPARRVAVLRFGGVAGARSVEKKAEELLATLTRHGFRHTGSPFLMRYDPSFIPGFLRRNEVAFELA